MAYSKYEPIWHLLSANDFKKEIPLEFHCIICKNVTVEPFSSHCQCKFCENCIREYLRNGKKCCPGEKTYCTEELLEIDSNVSKDFSAIRSIALCLVTCLNEACYFKCELENMNNHLRICGMNSAKCPYDSLGCEGVEMTRDSVKMHCYNECLNHTQLLVRQIDNLRNDINVMRKIMEKRYEEMIKVKEDSQRNEMRIIQMMEEIESLKEDGVRKSYEIGVLREELTIVKEAQNNRMDENVRRDEINEVLENVESLWTLYTNIGRQTLSINEIEPSQIFDEKRFIWKVDNFSKMENEGRPRRMILWRYSIKFRLTIWCTGDDLGLNCIIMKGEFDDGIDWPMKHKVCLSLINRDTMEEYKCKEYQYDTFRDKSAFNRPINKWNTPIGDYRFTSVQDVKETTGMIFEDSLIVSFTIDYQ